MNFSCIGYKISSMIDLYIEWKPKLKAEQYLRLEYRRRAVKTDILRINKMSLANEEVAREIIIEFEPALLHE